MRRREFIAGFGGAAVTSLAELRSARAQTRQLPVIGFLHTASAERFRSPLDAFHRGLRNAGYVEGQNVAIEYRWADGQLDRLPALAADLVRRNVAVIAATGGNISAFVAKAETTTIPIVFTSGSDPVKVGLVSSLNRPGGNVTGVSFFAGQVGSKSLGLLHELVPKSALVAVLCNPKSPEAELDLVDINKAARDLGREIQIFNASTAEEIDPAFATLTERRPGALLIMGDPFYAGRIGELATLVTRHRLPAIFVLRGFADAGGLMSYGASINDAYRQAGVYAGLIVKGEKPGDLPVIQSTRFELVLNVKTAQTLGIAFPPGVLAIADDVIE
jgi:putative ABC transport system substrate-binding protein